MTEARILQMLGAVAPDGLTMAQLREALATHDADGNVTHYDGKAKLRGALGALEYRGAVRDRRCGVVITWYTKETTCK